VYQAQLRSSTISLQQLVALAEMNWQLGVDLGCDVLSGGISTTIGQSASASSNKLHNVFYLG